MTAEEVRRSFRRLAPGQHPAPEENTWNLSGHDTGAWMAPGGLPLASLMAQRLALQPGERVLDLGCGRGQSSVFLASRYNVEVVSLDLWITAEERRLRAISAGVGTRITPLQGDIGRGLPSEFGSFDAIFCLQAFHCFATKAFMLRYLASLLKPGGRICFAQGCFNREPEPFPALFRDTEGWNAQYSNYHSTGWWRDHLASCGRFDEVTAEEMPHGEILWEDDVLRRGDRAGWSERFLSDSAWLIRQIAYGKTNSPTLTHCIVSANRKA